MPTDAEPHPSAVTLKSRLRALEGSPVLATVGLLAVFIVAHTIVLWIVDVLADWAPRPPLDEVVEAVGVALLCTPLVLLLIRRFERRARLALHALDVASDGFWVADAQGRLLEVNQGYARMSGFSRSELLRMSVHDFEAQRSAEQTRLVLTAVIARGHGRLDTRHRRKDGSVFDVNITTAWLPEFDCLAAFLREGQTQIAGPPGDAGRARALQRLLDSTAAGICEVDREGRCTYINRAALKMLDREREVDQLIGTPVHHLFHAHTSVMPGPRQGTCPVCEAHRSGRAWQAEGELLRRFDGTTFAVAYWSSPVFELGVARGSIDTFVDLTDRAR